MKIVRKKKILYKAIQLGKKCRHEKALEGLGKIAVLSQKLGLYE